MLVEFKIANYGAFRDKASFSMVAGRSRNDAESLLSVPNTPHMHLLPVTAIYGANASGKSTFIKALASLRRMVKHGHMQTEPFALDKQSESRPTSFEITLLIGEEMWTYQLDILGREVQSESLLLMGKRGTSKTVFSRDAGIREVKLSKSIFSSESDRQFSQQLAAGLPAHKLLLHTAADIQPAGLGDVAKKLQTWFTDTLCIIGAESVRASLSHDFFVHSEKYAQALKATDTGIKKLHKKPVDLQSLEFPLKDRMLEIFKSMHANNMSVGNEPSIQLSKEDGQIKAYRWKTLHSIAGDEDEYREFDLEQESNGTRRLMHLLPILIEREFEQRVYVIDELDRSLHTLLSRYIIERQLELAREGERQQLIFSTHDMQLMDQTLLRKDEIWITERDAEGASQLLSFEEFKDIRKDKDVRKSYLEGRMGGVPELRPL